MLQMGKEQQELHEAVKKEARGLNKREQGEMSDSPETRCCSSRQVYHETLNGSENLSHSSSCHGSHQCKPPLG